ncbi:TonB-dependent receptor [Pseudoxanthomonas broegbernensis]|uniref:TonB-dependent receptor n=1 Tax=Pseudoxanthomonas broegbernensis TaxID=83619 RepID=A0A7V8GM15_9GAMM|nr:TonB-dependent receptor [Pseudoxanthomonas broegbernensis]KAF1686195.1 TonB-dependent receptor [Pseudoxanthomonas broegbernensis]MBB6063849.1 iron complex outermembrane receptor protein [Pseudoxanthomonas broegbernensis]
MTSPRPHLSLLVPAIAVALACVPASAFAADAREPVDLDRIDVLGRSGDTPVAPTVADERERLARVPGGTNLVDLRNAGRQATLRDALEHQPGIVLQEFFGGIDQPRLNIRGSGIQSNPVNRGVLLLQDGLPLNEADGSFVIGLLEQRNAAFISARRGANALSPGATALGGEIDFYSLNGADERGRLRLEGGSDGRRGGQLAWGVSGPRADGWIGASHDAYDGYRRHADGERDSVHVNTGWRAGETFSNRTWLSWTDLFFHIPNVVPKARIHSDPRGVMGDGDTPQDNLLNVYRRDPLRDTRHWRVANASQWGGERLRQSLGLWWQHTDDLFKNPTTHNVSDTDTWGAQYQAAGERGDLDYRLGGAYTAGDTARDFYANSPADGTRLQRFGHYGLDAASLDLQAALGWRTGEHWRLLAEAKWSRVERDAADLARGGGLEQRYAHASPRVGAIWQPRPGLRLFANLSRSNEVPTWWEIVSAEVPPASPAGAQAQLLRLRVQAADTLEIGGSGRFGGAERGADWSLAVYRSAVDDELMSMVDAFGNRVGTYNYTAGTTHQGVEAGLDGRFPAVGGGVLEYRLAWTWSDFTFDDGQFAGNRIAGVPRHLVSAELAWRSGGWRIGPNVRWLPGDTPTDHANTRDIYQDGYALLGARLDYTAADGRWTVFVHADNLTDRRYASSYVIRNQGTLAQPGFLQGVGRNATLGLTWRF